MERERILCVHMSETARATWDRFPIYAAVAIVAWHVSEHALSEHALCTLVDEHALFHNPLLEKQVRDGKFHFHTLFLDEARGLVRLLERDVAARCREAALRLLRWHCTTLRSYAYNDDDDDDDVDGLGRWRPLPSEAARAPETRPLAREYAAVRAMVERYLCGHAAS